MRKALAVVLFLALTGCSADPAPADVAPPDTISRYPSTAPPPAMTRDNGQTVAAALPTDAEVTGLTRPATPPPTTLKLCPTAPLDVPTSLVHAAGYWAGGAGQSLAVVTVLDQKTPADQLLATLSPQACPAKDDKGGQYLYDRQPYESKDGWTGSLNTSLRTDPTGTKSYEAIYLLSKGTALVNVVAGGPVGPTVTFDPTIDETAAHYLQLVLDRFAA